MVTAFTFIAGSLLLAPALVFMDIPLFPDVSRAPFAFLWMSVMVTGAAYVFLFQGLSKLPAAAGSLLYFVKPPIASCFAWIMLGEHPATDHHLAIGNHPAGGCSRPPWTATRRRKEREGAETLSGPSLKLSWTGTNINE